MLHRVSAAIILLLCSCAAHGSDRDRQIEAIFRPLVSASSPGFAVLVLKHGRTVFERGYGLCDLETKAPITPTTNFRLASITKQFTAAAIMLLAREGKVRYDDTLTRFFPSFPSYGNAITIRELLTHTSGLPDYEDLYEAQFPGTAAGTFPQISDAGVLEVLSRQPAGIFPPGARWRYSNSGYAMLAMIVEVASGTRFEDFLQQRIFRPLGMAHTVAFVKQKNRVHQRAFGYIREKAGWQFRDQSDTSAVLGDGGVYSSLHDLAQWNAALENHTLFSEAEMRPALEPVNARREDGAPVQYGFGWFLDPYKSKPRMYHNGETSGFRTTIQRFTQDRLTIIILANRTDVDPEALALRIADIF
ncbi:MAG: beta-lactamase family protein [Acidobacteria bacterium]|nr:beta-lactamase family protein [Acidobacteriota bacterium]